ncbi:LGFP repeat-containing protein [Hoyosella subflava]|uniref:Putative secreted protein n=1 Tax=Hoyosella subflava (strain DSM 45089 / JCM 17490 / NBRC 109087 / DQS3-9A1) TaxID=443218 RepID=F6ESD2_HOYSD|nr:hypothetical protein [Hoyosella subflava]AEF43053.1 Putative secreted protein [Hoyosella subflava DQS3-9A1]
MTRKWLITAAIAMVAASGAAPAGAQPDTTPSPSPVTTTQATPETADSEATTAPALSPSGTEAEEPAREALRPGSNTSEDALTPAPETVDPERTTRAPQTPPSETPEETAPDEESPSVQATREPAVTAEEAPPSVAEGEGLPYPERTDGVESQPMQRSAQSLPELRGTPRSEREPIPEGFSKEEADLAERMEMATTSGCQTFWPSPHLVCGAILDRYLAMGGPNSWLSLPNSPEYTNPDGVGKRSQFLNGSIYWHPTTGAHPVTILYMTKWDQLGWETGWLGYPTAAEIPHSPIGSQQEFQGAGLFWTQPVGVYAVGGAIRTKYDSTGGPGGPLGYPTTDEIAVNNKNGRYNNFQNGTISWSADTGSRVLYGPIRDRWTQLGREDGPLGYPLSDEQSAANGTARYVEFENGSSIWWTAVTGAHEISSDILAVWQTYGAHDGNLGYPVSPAVTPQSNARNSAHDGPAITKHQKFEGGIVNLAGDRDAYVGMYDPTPDNVPEPQTSVTNKLEQTRQQNDTWPPDIPKDHDTSKIVGEATNIHHPLYGTMVIRQGYYSGAWQDGWGQNKAQHYHQLNYIDSIEFVLESRYSGPRSDTTLAGRDFWAYATHSICELTWSGRQCQEVERRVVHAIYDPLPWPTYKFTPGGDPIGVVTAFCGGGTSPLAGTTICDPWVDVALLNPTN